MKVLQATAKWIGEAAFGVLTIAGYSIVVGFGFTTGVLAALLWYMG